MMGLLQQASSQAGRDRQAQQIESLNARPSQCEQLAEILLLGTSKSAQLGPRTKQCLWVCLTSKLRLHVAPAAFTARNCCAV